MCDKNANLSSNSEQTIPRFVGQYRRKEGEKIPEIVVINSETHLTKAERRVCDFFKCTVNWDQSINHEPVDTTSKKNDKLKCFATRQTTLCFETHLKEKHSSLNKFFCVYCYNAKNGNSLSNKSSVQTYPYRYLIKHSLKRHRFRRFQCNLCLYRALTEEHILVHQKSEHSSEYSKAIEANSSESTDESICKIFFCPKVTEDNRNLIFYWNKYKEKRLNSEGKNETYFQCLFCSFMDESKPKVIDHCVQRHPDYPILYYIPDPQVSSSSFIELNNNFSFYDDIPVVRPKLEPQDNIVSSTQKSPETEIRCITVTDISDQRRRSIEEDISAKRIRLDSSEITISKNNGNQNLVTKDMELSLCLFCDKSFAMMSDATNHFRDHFKNCEDDKSVTRDWIQSFVRKQWQIASFLDSDTSKSRRLYYYCPLCVKMAKIRQILPKNYKKFSDLRKHVYDHCCWLSVKCKHCLHSIPNCDSIIAEHLKDDRNRYPILKKYQFLDTEESEMSFTEENLLELEKGCIEIKRNSVIDDFINKMLKTVKSDFEAKLRDKHHCKQTPEVVLKKLPELKFEKYFREYKEYENKKNNDLKQLNDKRCETINKSNKNQSKKESKLSSKQTSGHKSANSEKSGTSLTTSTAPTATELDILDNITYIKNNLREPAENCGATQSSTPAVRIRNISSEGGETETNKDSDAYNSDEESARIACYNCNEKFKHKRDFKDHSKKVHPNLPQRMYAKPRKQNN